MSILGPTVFAGVTLPWFLHADAITGGGVIGQFLWHHNVERALGEGNATAHVEPCTMRDCAGCGAG